jgi:hypothetical protein
VRLAIVLGLLVTAAALPNAASAHVGRTLPVATNFTARMAGFIPGVHARVVDGDQTMWLRASPAAVVLVPGTLGEPMLRFDAHGVWLNLRSPTAQADGIDRFDLRPSASPQAPPRWHRVAGGHAYAWHEHRLHALQPLARGRSSAGPVGPWSVPVIVNGRRLALNGVLDYTPPSVVWAWVALSAVLAAASSALATKWTTALVALALTATSAVWAIRIGRELYGRPNVTAVGYAGVAITCAVGAAFVYGLVRRDEGIRVLTAFLVGVGALYEGLTMLPVLTHAIALSALPTTVARLLEVLTLGAGIGALVGSVFGHLRTRPTLVPATPGVQ